MSSASDAAVVLTLTMLRRLFCEISCSPVPVPTRLERLLHHQSERESYWPDNKPDCPQRSDKPQAKHLITQCDVASILVRLQLTQPGISNQHQAS